MLLYAQSLPSHNSICLCTAGLIGKLLDQQNSDQNGLTKTSLANLFAEVWFERMPLDFRASSQDLKPADITNLQRLADGVVEVAERRSAFVAAFLEPSEP